MRNIYLSLVLVCSLVMAGCQPVEMSARDSIASAKGFIDSVAAAHPECNTVPTGQVCVLVNRGNAVKHTAIDALVLYCAGPAFNDGSGACQPPTDKAVQQQSAEKLKAAIANLDQIVKDIRSIR
jgi:hypothetical protein